MFTSKIKQICKCPIQWKPSLLINNSHNLNKHQSEIMQRGLPKVKPIKNVKKIIVVASGKGGVGKSTVAVNLATSMKIVAPEKSIGLLDVDIFGPSIPLLMNLHDSPLLDNNKQMLPLTNYGVKCMSMGFLIEDGSPVIWRGLMVMQAVEKLICGVNWGSIDYLIVDTPPGTGDTHLSLVQNIPIDGVILVTTPQKTAVQVTKRGAIMFNKLNVPIIGLIENMSFVQCPNCSSSVKLFGNSVQQFSEETDIPILQKVPVERDLTKCSDIGTPIGIQQPDSAVANIYKSLSNQVLNYSNKK